MAVIRALFVVLIGAVFFGITMSGGAPQVTGNGCNGAAAVTERCANTSTGVTGNGAFAPTPSPSPGGCGTIPTLTPGQEYSASFAPFCTGPWTQRVQANCLSVGTCVASWSQATINAEFGGGGNNCGDCVIQVSGGPDGRGGAAYAELWYTSSSDPVITVKCSGSWCDTTDNGGLPGQTTSGGITTFHMSIPAVARMPGGNCGDGGDHAWGVIQPNGDEIDIAYNTCFQTSVGSGPNGNWRTGDTLVTVVGPNVGAAANCGNFATGSGFIQNSVVSASGACWSAGHLRANEILSGIPTHALRNISECTGTAGGAAAIFPAGNFARSNAGNTCPTPGDGPPMGAHLWWDENRATMSSRGLTDQTWLFIFDALNQFGMYNTDNVNGGPPVGFGEIIGDGGVEFSQYASTPGSTSNNPYRNLSNWSVSGSENPSELDFGVSHNQPNIFAGHVGTGDFLDPKVHMHFLNTCAATSAPC